MSLVRSGIGVDTTPNDTNVEQFAYHLLAEFEQLALTEKKPGASTAAAKGEQPKLKSLEAERTKAKKGDEETGRSPTKREEGKDEKPKCRFSLQTKVAKGERHATFPTMSKMKREDAGIAAAQAIRRRHAQDQRIRMTPLHKSHHFKRLRGRKSHHQAQRQRRMREAQNRRQ